jgi:uncharacterized protein
MNIRSITLGVNWKDQSKTNLSKDIAQFMQVAQDAYRGKDYDVRTCRLSMPPINEYSQFSYAGARSIVGWVSDLCQQVGIRWFCVPFSLVNCDDPKGLSQTAYEIVNRHSNAFVNMIVARKGVVNQEGVKEASQLIHSVARINNNGFDNFRVGVSCNCEPHTPYFPFAYHEGKNGFSLALEFVDELLEISERYIRDGLPSVRESILEYLVEKLFEIDKIGQEIEQKTNIAYLGLDASLAPFPNGDTSVAKLIEVLGVEDFGSNGSLFITSYLTDIIKTALARSGAHHVGFNGVMYSLLEDDYLALRNRQKNFTLDSLMLYSSVCGCGIDMVPVPGDILNTEISAMIFDVVALSATLNKPLGVRVLPIIGKSANELTDFNYDFLVDTRVMQVRNREFSIVSSPNNQFSYLRES